MKTSIKDRVPIFIMFAVFVLFQTIHSQAQTLKADYRFQGNLSSSVPGVPDLTNLVGAGNGPNTFATDSVDGFSQQVLNFPLNNGVSINDFTSIVPSTTSFTVVVLFKFSALSGMRRLVDVSGGTAPDSGYFMFDGKIIDESTSHAPTDANSYFQVVFVRGTGGVISIYRDNIIGLADPDDGTPLSAGIRLFQDWSGASPVQASSGSVARLRVYDGPLTLQQVHQLDRVPETPAGSLPVLFYSNRSGVNEMFRMNSNGTSQKRITNNEVLDYVGKFSPDGQKIVYQRRESSADPFQVWISNADGSNPLRLTNTTSIDHFPSWRPDGQKILFSRCNPVSGVCDLFTMNPDGTNQAAIVTTATDEDGATFTPNGAKLVFACSDQNLTNYQICVSDANGTNRVAITNTTAPVISQSINISPDGTKLACVQGSNAGNNVIKTMNLDGSNVVTWPLVNNPQIPLWSPDGTKIMYSSIAGNQFEIFTADPNGASPVRLTFNSALDIATDWYRSTRRTLFDFDGDGKADQGVFRPEEGVWYLLQSHDGVKGVGFGLAGDKPVAADYDGDGRTDVAIYRNGVWWILYSDGSGYRAVQWGTAGDIPVPADYDGDGKADLAVYRNGTWWILFANGAGYTAIQWGLASDKPVAADYDGDGKADAAVYRDGTWWMLNSNGSGYREVQWGLAGDTLVPADYDGDGKADPSIYRNGEWWIRYGNGSGSTTIQWGIPGDEAVPADYNGDGKTDPAIYRNGGWWALFSNGYSQNTWGLSTDIPVSRR